MNRCHWPQVVITSGGVGPTLDDVTMEGVAAALGAQLVRHPNLERRLLEYFGQAATAAHLKMAQTPDQVQRCWCARLVRICCSVGGQTADGFAAAMCFYWCRKRMDHVSHSAL